MKNKKKKLISINILLFVFVNFIFFFLGICTYKKDSTRKLLEEVNKIFNFSITNYNSGKNAIIETLEINLSDSCYNVIKTNRNLAVLSGFLKEECKEEVPANLVWNNDTIKVKMRLKGDLPDHWSGEKWSFRINVKGNNSFDGMDKFSIQDPKTRNHLIEWYYLKLLENEDLIALRYKFIKVVLNGEDKGIFAVEESFSKELLENNGKKESPIFKFDEYPWMQTVIAGNTKGFSQEDFFIKSKIKIFKPKKTLKDSIKQKHYKRGVFLLAGLRDESINLDEALDIKSAASLFAICDLTGSYHGLRWHNQRFYYNPIIDKLEMIGFDSNSGILIDDIYFNLWKHNKINELHGLSRWKSILFKNKFFVKEYMKQLRKISSKEYLNSFNLKLNSELKRNLNIIFSENAFYKFDLKIYKKNASTIRHKIDLYYKNDSLINNHINQVRSFFKEKKDGSIVLNIKNNSLKSIQIIGLFDKNDSLISHKTNENIFGRLTNEFCPTYSFDLGLSNEKFDTFLSKKKVINSSLVYSKCELKYKINGSDSLYKCYVEAEQYVLKNSYKESLLNFCNLNGTILTLKNKANIFGKDFIVPKGFTLIIPKGSQIDLINGANFISFGNLLASGTKFENILIKSSDSSANFSIMNAQKKSIINWTKFSGLTSSSNKNDYSCSGGLTVYSSYIEMNNVIIQNSKSEDGLNIVRSAFKLSNITFVNIQSDALDSDFSTGIVESSAFTNVGNDALDFSGSFVNLKDININNIGDKGISAGEKSEIFGQKISINHCELGLVSKDNSVLQLDGVEIKNISVAVLAFQKKREYGPSSLVLNNTVIGKHVEKYLLEYDSTIELNKRLIPPNYKNVTGKLYGNEYGKSSK